VASVYDRQWQAGSALLRTVDKEKFECWNCTRGSSWGPGYGTVGTYMKVHRLIAPNTMVDSRRVGLLVIAPTTSSKIFTRDAKANNCDVKHSNPSPYSLQRLAQPEGCKLTTTMLTLFRLQNKASHIKYQYY
jgi:hypothetical protein